MVDFIDRNNAAPICVVLKTHNRRNVDGCDVVSAGAYIQQMVGGAPAVARSRTSIDETVGFYQKTLHMSFGKYQLSIIEVSLSDDLADTFHQVALCDVTRNNVLYSEGYLCGDHQSTLRSLLQEPLLYLRKANEH